MSVYETQKDKEDFKNHNATLFREYVKNNCFSELVGITKCMEFFDEYGNMTIKIHDLI